MKKVLIYGAGDKGKRLLRMIDGNVFSNLMKLDVVAFIDQRKPAGSYIQKRPIIRPRDIIKYQDAEIIISSDKILDEVCLMLFELKINNKVYYCPEYTYKFKSSNYMPPFVYLDIEKPRLPYLEISISAKCNLNCKGCSAFSNMEKPWNLTPKELEEAYVALGKKFSGIKYLKLYGGEPLLNPWLSELISLSRDYWYDSEIVVHSNGLLVPGLDISILEVMEQKDVSFVFTLYPETGKKQRFIEEKLGKHGVEYTFRKPVYQFYKLINPNGDYDSIEVYKNCGKCINLHDRVLSCGFDWQLNEMEKFFDMQIFQGGSDHIIDIFETELDGWQINRLLDSPSSMCKYCAFMRYNELDVSQAFDWEPYAKGNKEDWLITND